MIGGGDYITPTRQYTWYGSGKQPAKYMLPTTLYKSLKNPLMMVLGRAIYYSQNPKPESTSILKEFPWKKHHYQPEEWGFFKGFPQNNQKCLILSSPTTGVGIKTNDPCWRQKVEQKKHVKSTSYCPLMGGIASASPPDMGQHPRGWRANIIGLPFWMRK